MNIGRSFVVRSISKSTIRDQILALDRSLSEAQMQAEVGIRPITDVELARAAMEEAKIRLAREVLSPPCR